MRRLFTGSEIAENEIAAIYEKIVYWKRNLFMLPTGANVSQHKYFLSSKLPLQRRCTLCQHYSYKSHPKDHVNVLELDERRIQEAI